MTHQEGDMVAGLDLSDIGIRAMFSWAEYPGERFRKEEEELPFLKNLIPSIFS